MKQFLVLICFLPFSFITAQDTIYTKSGSRIAAKVIEMNQDEIKYKKSANPDGPLYVVDKNAVSLIEYKNGSKDVFSEESNSYKNKDESIEKNTPPYYSSGPRTSVFITPRPYYWGPRPRVYVKCRPFHAPRVRVRCGWWW